MHRTLPFLGRRLFLIQTSHQPLPASQALRRTFSLSRPGVKVITAPKSFVPACALRLHVSVPRLRSNVFLGHTSLHHRYISASSNMSLNGQSRQKRKSSPIDSQDRPAKMAKNEKECANGSISPEQGSEQSLLELDQEELLPPQVQATVDTAEWQATIEKVVKNVVSIHFCQTCSFDTDAAVSSEATGFVVDAKRGYILTNRHVVGAGPFWGYCIFDNHEEVCSVGCCRSVH